jgi:hypothetical protein
VLSLLNIFILGFLARKLIQKYTHQLDKAFKKFTNHFTFSHKPCILSPEFHEKASIEFETLIKNDQTEPIQSPKPLLIQPIIPTDFFDVLLIQLFSTHYRRILKIDLKKWPLWLRQKSNVSLLTLQYQLLYKNINTADTQITLSDQERFDLKDFLSTSRNLIGIDQCLRKDYPILKARLEEFKLSVYEFLSDFDDVLAINLGDVYAKAITDEINLDECFDNILKNITLSHIENHLNVYASDNDDFRRQWPTIIKELLRQTKVASQSLDRRLRAHPMICFITDESMSQALNRVYRLLTKSTSNIPVQLEAAKKQMQENLRIRLAQSPKNTEIWVTRLQESMQHYHSIATDYRSQMSAVISWINTYANSIETLYLFFQRMGDGVTNSTALQFASTVENILDQSIQHCLLESRKKNQHNNTASSSISAVRKRLLTYLTAIKKLSPQCIEPSTQFNLSDKLICLSRYTHHRYHLNLEFNALTQQIKSIEDKFLQERWMDINDELTQLVAMTVKKPYQGKTSVIELENIRQKIKNQHNDCLRAMRTHIKKLYTPFIAFDTNTITALKQSLKTNILINSKLKSYIIKQLNALFEDLQHYKTLINTVTQYSDLAEAINVCNHLKNNHVSEKVASFAQLVEEINFLSWMNRFKSTAKKLTLIHSTATGRYKKILEDIEDDGFVMQVNRVLASVRPNGGYRLLQNILNAQIDNSQHSLSDFDAIESTLVDTLITSINHYNKKTHKMILASKSQEGKIIKKRLHKKITPLIHICLTRFYEGEIREFVTAAHRLLNKIDKEVMYLKGFTTVPIMAQYQVAESFELYWQSLTTDAQEKIATHRLGLNDRSSAYRSIMGLVLEYQPTNTFLQWWST